MTISTRKPTHTTMTRVAALGTTAGTACSEETARHPRRDLAQQGAGDGGPQGKRESWSKKRQDP